MSRYKFIVTEDKVICISSYMGRIVRGIAKCSPKDAFNEEFGRKLAQARCDYKVAQKRFNRATLKSAEADLLLEKAEAQVDKMNDYYWEAEEALDEASNYLTELLESEADSHPFEK